MIKTILKLTTSPLNIFLKTIHFNSYTIYNDYNISTEVLIEITMKIKPSLQNNSIKNRMTCFITILTSEFYDSNESKKKVKKKKIDHKIKK